MATVFGVSGICMKFHANQLPGYPSEHDVIPGYSNRVSIRTSTCQVVYQKLTPSLTSMLTSLKTSEAVKRTFLTLAIPLPGLSVFLFLHILHTFKHIPYRFAMDETGLWQ